MCVAKRGRQKIKTVTRALACVRARVRFALVSRPRTFFHASTRGLGEKARVEIALARDKLISTLRRSSLAVSREFLTNVLALAEDGEFA